MEQAEVRLAAYPTASPDDITPQGLGVRVVLVNESLRPIVLRSAALLLDGETVSRGDRLDRRRPAAGERGVGPVPP